MIVTFAIKSEKVPLTSQPCRENNEDLIANFLAFQTKKENEVTECKNLLYELWSERKKIF